MACRLRPQPGLRRHRQRPELRRDDHPRLRRGHRLRAAARRPVPRRTAPRPHGRTTRCAPPARLRPRRPRLLRHRRRRAAVPAGRRPQQQPRDGTDRRGRRAVRAGRDDRRCCPRCSCCSAAGCSGRSSRCTAARPSNVASLFAAMGSSAGRRPVAVLACGGVLLGALALGVFNMPGDLRQEDSFTDKPESIVGDGDPRRRLPRAQHPADHRDDADRPGRRDAGEGPYHRRAWRPPNAAAAAAAGPNSPSSPRLRPSRRASRPPSRLCGRTGRHGLVCRRAQCPADGLGDGQRAGSEDRRPARARLRPADPDRAAAQPRRPAAAASSPSSRSGAPRSASAGWSSNRSSD